MAFEAVIIPVLTVIFVGSMISIFIFRRKQKAVKIIASEDLTRIASGDGLDIPLLQSFSGLKALGPLVFWNNNLNPKLALFSDHFDYKVMIRRSAYYSDIASIRCYRSRYYNRLRFIFQHKAVCFTAVFGNEESLQTVLTLLAEKGIRPDAKSRL